MYGKSKANLQREAWTVIIKMDTIMLKTWLNEASKYQAEPYPVVNPNRANAPETIKLSTDVCFSTHMGSMGKRETNVRKVKNIRLSALKDNKERMDVVINLYESGKLPNYLTAGIWSKDSPTKQNGRTTRQDRQGKYQTGWQIQHG